MLRAALCDDRAEDLSQLRALVEAYRRARPGLELTAYPYTGASAVLDAGVDFDVFLLDILMPGLNGIQLGRELRRHYPAAPILYLTSSRDFALESYRTEALDYLVKPLSQSAVFYALDRAVDRCRAEYASAIPIPVEDGVRRVRFAELLYAEVLGRTLRCHLLSGPLDAAVRRPTFAQLWDALEPDGRFLLVRRGCLVNMDHVVFWENETAELAGGARIPIARERRPTARRAYLAYCCRRFSARGETAYG